MSNTSNLSPYDTTTASDASPGIGACVAAAAAGAVLGAVALASWLAEETPEDRRAVDRYHEERRRERIREAARESVKPLAVTTLHLHSRDVEALVETAQKLGYRLERFAGRLEPLSMQSQLLLRKPSGERLAIQRNERGKLSLSTVGGKGRIEELVCRHTVDRAVSYLEKAGMQVRTASLASGEVQILAREIRAGRGGAAEVKAQVRKDGKVWMDVDRLRGNRCEEIVSRVAEAVGAEVNDMKKKDACFQLPGEPAQVRERVSS